MKSRTESERDVYKAALDEVADNVAAVWQHGPAPKDGSWILGMFKGFPFVVYWASWQTGEDVPGEGVYLEGEESGWCTAQDDSLLDVDGDPDNWARIIPPDKMQPARWEGGVFGYEKVVPSKYRVCTKCKVMHYENCETCFGFGLYTTAGMYLAYPLSESKAIDGIGTDVTKLFPCPECKSTNKGVPAWERARQASIGRKQSRNTRRLKSQAMKAYWKKKKEASK